jgi:hypothetical protein
MRDRTRDLRIHPGSLDRFSVRPYRCPPAPARARSLNSSHVRFLHVRFLHVRFLHDMRGLGRVRQRHGTGPKHGPRPCFEWPAQDAAAARVDQLWGSIIRISYTENAAAARAGGALSGTVRSEARRAQRGVGEPGPARCRLP